MQRERMTERFVPSIREYAARYQIDSRRWGHGSSSCTRARSTGGSARPRGHRLPVADRPIRSPPASSCGWRSSTSCSRGASDRGSEPAVGGDGASEKPTPIGRAGMSVETHGDYERRGLGRARRGGRRPGPARGDGPRSGRGHRGASTTSSCGAARSPSSPRQGRPPTTGERWWRLPACTPSPPSSTPMSISSNTSEPST